MISHRVLWRTVVVPVYLLVAGAVFSGAFAGTAGSSLSYLSALSSWPMLLASIAAAIALTGGIVRIMRLKRRRTRNTARRTHAAADCDPHASVP